MTLTVHSGRREQTARQSSVIVWQNSPSWVAGLFLSPARECPHSVTYNQITFDPRRKTLRALVGTEFRNSSEWTFYSIHFTFQLR